MGKAKRKTRLADYDFKMAESNLCNGPTFFERNGISQLFRVVHKCTFMEVNLQDCKRAGFLEEGFMPKKPLKLLMNFSRSPFPASFASTLNVPMSHCAILFDGSCSRVFRFPYNEAGLKLDRISTRN